MKPTESHLHIAEMCTCYPCTCTWANSQTPSNILEMIKNWSSVPQPSGFTVIVQVQAWQDNGKKAVWCSFRGIDSNNSWDQFPNPKAHGRKKNKTLIVQGNPQHTETELGAIPDCSRVQPLSRRLVPEHKPCVEVSQTISSQRGGIPYSRSQFLHPGIGKPDSCSFHIAQTPMTYGGPIGRLRTAEHG